jgi:hypothetical protein
LESEPRARHDEIDSTEAIVHRRAEALDIATLPQIHGEEFSTMWSGVPRCLAGAIGDASTEFGCAPHDRGANAARTSGDNADLSVQRFLSHGLGT